MNNNNNSRRKINKKQVFFSSGFAFVYILIVYLFINPTSLISFLPKIQPIYAILALLVIGLVLTALIYEFIDFNINKKIILYKESLRNDLIKETEHQFIFKTSNEEIIISTNVDKEKEKLILKLKSAFEILNKLQEFYREKIFEYENNSRTYHLLFYIFLFSSLIWTAMLVNFYEKKFFHLESILHYLAFVFPTVLLFIISLIFLKQYNKNINLVEKASQEIKGIKEYKMALELIVKVNDNEQIANESFNNLCSKMIEQLFKNKNPKNGEEEDIDISLNKDNLIKLLSPLLKTIKS